MILGSCLGTVTSLTSHEDDIAKQSWGTRWGWGRGCLTVQEYLPDLDVSDMPSTPTTSAEPLQIKAKDLPGTELEVCLKFAFFISQEVFFSVM